MIWVDQTVAMFVDAYRELARGKIFWIALGLSGVIVAVFAGVGIDQSGLSIFGIDLGFIPVTSSNLPPDLLYKWMFSEFGVGVWLTWIAAILGIISTAGIIPAFVSSGAIEVHVSKPIGRVRLFLTKYVTGLVFMGIQVFVFSAASFLVIGVRGGAWEPGVFLAVPITVLFFSYIYSVSAIVGLLTRSSVTAMLVTLLAWFLVFIVNSVDSTMLQFKIEAEKRYDWAVRSAENAEVLADRSLERMAESGEALPDRSEWAAGVTDEREAVNPFLRSRREARDEAAEDLAGATKWHGRVLLVKTVLPKTQETVALLDRSLLSAEDYDRILNLFSRGRPTTDEADEDRAPVVGDAEITRATAEALHSRSIPWIIGTSLGFEVFVVGLACLLFARRDF